MFKKNYYNIHCLTILTYLFLINPVLAQVKLSPTGTDYYNKGGGEVKSFSSTNNNLNKTKSFSDFLDNMVCNRAVHQFRWDLNKIEYVCEAKRRNLKCGVSQSYPESCNRSSVNILQKNQTINFSKNINSLSDYVICIRSNWKEEYEPYVKEANKRKLSYTLENTVF